VAFSYESSEIGILQFFLIIHLSILIIFIVCFAVRAWGLFSQSPDQFQVHIRPCQGTYFLMMDYLKISTEALIHTIVLFS